MEHWQEILRDSVTTLEELNERLACDTTALGEVIANFPMRINPYFLNLIQVADDPIWKQVVPSLDETTDQVCMVDPLGEEDLSPVPNLVHKYPDRVLFLISNQCGVYCRFCTRKRKVGKPQMIITEDTLQEGYGYLKDNPSVKEVLLSGGDPFLLEDKQIEEILSNLKAIPSIEIIRIGTRTPSVLPMRITDKLVDILKNYHPLYINTHFNHPTEITAEAQEACTKLADAGIPLGCQTVLLRGVNDDAATLQKLFRILLQIRVKPYYLFQTDLTRGTNHFRTPTSVGLKIMKALYGHLSGMAIPTFALDGPGGVGKIPLTPDFVRKSNPEYLEFRNFQDKISVYPEIITR